MPHCRKRARLLSPAGAEFYRLYPRHWFSDQYHFSKIKFPRDQSWPDCEAFPEFAKARALESVLKPGDMLFIPGFWWHTFHGLDLSMSVTTFWSTSE